MQNSVEYRKRTIRMTITWDGTTWDGTTWDETTKDVITQDVTTRDEDVQSLCCTSMERQA
jgi:hypothetical protein